MTIEWNDSYMVGLDILDSQHKELVERIRVLLEAMRQGRGDVATILGVLEGYAIEHFDTEERLMSSKPEIDFSKHKEQHYFFRRAMTNLMDKYSSRGESAKLALNLQQNLWQWLGSHMMITDKKFAKILRGKESAQMIQLSA
ncbi:MAG: bacteriohemerythrin [Thermodesulfobacteriota bacterium]|nr:MAG: bacteriohemerythrin [Thermodesulfobacteriota bacterium]